MTKHPWTFFAFFALWLSGSLSSIAGPVDLVGWNLTGTTENPVPGDQEFTPAAFSAPNVTGNVVTRGDTLSPRATNNSISSEQWDTMAEDDYFSFGFIIDPGYRVQLNQLLISTQSSPTGPGTVALRYNGDNFGANLAEFDQRPGGNRVNSVVELWTLGLGNLTGTVEFRLFAANNLSARSPWNGADDSIGSTGTLRITNYFVGSNDTGSFRFTGTVEAIPEPSSLALLSVLGVGAFGFWLRRRKS